LAVRQVLHQNMVFARAASNASSGRVIREAPFCAIKGILEFFRIFLEFFWVVKGGPCRLEVKLNWVQAT
jgi:hypothetical protein